MAVFKLEILTPGGGFFEGEVELVNFINGIGNTEILPNHINYLSEILPSVLTIKQDGIVKNAAVMEGIIDFKKNNASIIVEAAEWPDEIDLERAKRAYDRAKDRIKSRDAAIDKKRAELALKRATVRIKCAEMSKSSGRNA